MVKIMYRKALKTDLDTLWILHREALGPYIKMIWGWDENVQRKMFLSKNRIENCEVIENGSIVGQIVHYIKGDSYYLESILIFPFYHGSGYANDALNRVEDTAWKHKMALNLQVFKINARAIRFYEKHGYIRIGESENHFQYRKSD